MRTFPQRLFCLVDMPIPLFYPVNSPCLSISLRVNHIGVLEVRTRECEQKFDSMGWALFNEDSLDADLLNRFEHPYQYQSPGNYVTSYQTRIEVQKAPVKFDFSALLTPKFTPDLPPYLMPPVARFLCGIDCFEFLAFADANHLSQEPMQPDLANRSEDLDLQETMIKQARERFDAAFQALVLEDFDFQKTELNKTMQHLQALFSRFRLNNVWDEFDSLIEAYSNAINRPLEPRTILEKPLGWLRIAYLNLLKLRKEPLKLSLSWASIKVEGAFSDLEKHLQAFQLKRQIEAALILCQLQFVQWMQSTEDQYLPWTLKQSMWQVFSGGMRKSISMLSFQWRQHWKEFLQASCKAFTPPNNQMRLEQAL